MKLATTAALAVAALLRAKMRSLLTTLGVVIGVAAVIIMQAMGTGAAALVTGELAGMGTNILMVVPGATQGVGGASLDAPMFTRGDLEAIREEASAMRYASIANIRSVRAVVGEENRSTNLFGVSPEHFDIRQWPASIGRILTDEDQKQGAKVCVIGETNRLELFGAVDPVGAELRVHGMGCGVVGVLEAKGASAFGQDQDDVVMMPASTYGRRIMGDDKIAVMMLSAVSEDRIDEAKAQVEVLLRERRRILPGEDDNFTVHDMRELISILSNLTGVLTSLLAGVAAVSLQFFVEAVVLSLLGGVLGLILGVAGSYAASELLDIPFTVPPLAAVIAVAVSMLVGVVFGVFPARKAAHLRPIEALRFE